MSNNKPICKLCRCDYTHIDNSDAHDNLNFCRKKCEGWFQERALLLQFQIWHRELDSLSFEDQFTVLIKIQDDPRCYYILRRLRALLEPVPYPAQVNVAA